MKIASLPILNYTEGEIDYVQFIRGEIGAGHHQEPEFFQFSDGEVLMYWNAYDIDEGSINCIKLYTTSKDYGLTWSDPEVFMADFLGGVPYIVKMLKLNGTNDVIMFVQKNKYLDGAVQIDKKRHTVTKAGDYFKTKRQLNIRYSNDGGRSFDHGIIYTDDKIGLNDLRQLYSGRIIASFSFLDPNIADYKKGSWKGQHYSLCCLISDDMGKSWFRSEDITINTPRGAMESQIVETEPGRLLCLFRTKAGYVHQTISEDGGFTWSKPEPSLLPSPEAMVRMIRLQSGNLLVVWNNSSSLTQQPRFPLVAVVSTDGGKTWSKPKVIANETGTNQLSNHGMIQLSDGRILLGVNHYRDIRPTTSDLDLAIFDENWLKNE